MKVKRFTISNDDIFLCGKDNDSIVFKRYFLFISEEEMELKSKYDIFILRFENKDLKIFMNGNYIDIDYFLQYIEYIECKTAEKIFFVEEFNKMLKDFIKKERIKEIGYDDSYLSLFDNFRTEQLMKYFLYLGSYQFYLITERLFKRFLKKMVKDFIECRYTNLEEIDNLLKLEKILGNKDIQWFFNEFFIITPNFYELSFIFDLYHHPHIGPNGLKVFHQFFELTNKIEKSVYRCCNYNSFDYLVKIFNIIDYYHVSCQNLVNFLIRKLFNDYHIDYITIIDDSIHMAKQYNIQLDKKLTSNIKEIHDKLAQKIKYIGAEGKNEKFKEKSDEYQKYLKCLPESNEFTILIPESPKDLIQEGEDMHHCVGSYINRYIEGKSKIFFVRKQSEEDKAYVTIELGEDNHLVQIQGKYDRYPGNKVHNFVKEWCKNIQKQEREEIYEQKENSL